MDHEFEWGGKWPGICGRCGGEHKPRNRAQALERLAQIKFEGEWLSAMMEDAEREDRADLKAGRFTVERNAARWAPVLAFEKKHDQERMLAQDQYREFAS